MSKIKEHQQIRDILLKDVLDQTFQLPQPEKPVLISFYRFATCPFCNLRLREIQAFQESNPEIEMVGVFGSPAEEVKKVIDIHNVTSPLVADTEGKLYREFGIKKSLWGVLKGMIIRMPSLFRAMLLDHIIPKAFHGHFLTMPAEFLIDTHGKVLISFYGKDEGDHINLERVVQALK